MAIVAVKEKETRSQDSLSQPYLVQEDNESLALSTDDAVAKASLQAGLDWPLEWGGRYSARRISDRLIRVEIQYRERSLSTPTAPPVGETTLDFRFNFTAKAKYLYRALACVDVYSSDGPGSPATHTLNVNEQSAGGVVRVVGAQIAPSAEVFTLDYTVPNVLITGVYQTLLARLCGCVSSSEFRGYAAGEIQLVRASGGRRTDDDWQLSFGFGLAENQTGVEVGGGIVVPTLKGHHYLWIRDYEGQIDSVDFSPVIGRVPLYAYVQQVWPEKDLNELGLPP